tara:strand:+ start:269 stop:1036 length:768 start_codon:yes stop_codon:yes gene_type:complete
MPEVVLPEENHEPKAGAPAVTETNIPEPPKHRPLVMTDHDAIGVFENGMPNDICDAVIHSFEHWYAKKYIVNDSTVDSVVAKTDDGVEVVTSIDTGYAGEKQFPKGLLGRKDTQLFLETHDQATALALSQWLGQAFKIYTDTYKGVVEGDPLSSWTYKIQKTPPGGGYHVWHCEDSGFLYRDRVLTWMVYLNDIPLENGGATDFLHQQISLQPKKGTMVFWPAAYTHMHRGAFLTGDIDKYIATGWFCREAPPNT